MGRVAAALGKTDRAIKAFGAAQSFDRSNVEAIRSLKPVEHPVLVN